MAKQVFIPSLDLLFLTVPKVACTSIKAFFFQVENDKPFTSVCESHSDSVRELHALYSCVGLDELPENYKQAENRYALVRDPVSRLVSCYENKILELGVMSRGEPANPDVLKQKNVSAEPQFDEFVENLATYQEISYNIFHHSEPLVCFLGEDASWFTELFDFSQIKKMERTLRRVTGTKNSIGRYSKIKQSKVSEIINRIKGVPKPYKNEKYCLPKKQITDEVIAKIKKIYAKDYEVFGHIFKTKYA